MFVTLEGGEGCGKSTLARALSAALDHASVPHIVTREPGGTPVAERIRALALDVRDGPQLSALAMALLMNAARADHLDTLIRPSLKAGKLVICDRFSDSTLAYQSVQGGVRRETLQLLEASVVGDTRPDITLLLDADPEALLKRRVARSGESDVFENKDLSFHRRIRSAFLQIAEDDRERVIVLDALASTQALTRQAMALIEARGMSAAGQ